MSTQNSLKRNLKPQLFQLNLPRKTKLLLLMCCILSPLKINSISLETSENLKKLQKILISHKRMLPLTVLLMLFDPLKLTEADKEN
jgi:hypothetical protein